MNRGFAMSVRAGICVALLGFLALAGCNPYPLPGHLVTGRCGADSHTESYPLAHEERRAYGCKSNNAGYLETASQGDKRRN
jgi:hypothetical protein